MSGAESRLQAAVEGAYLQALHHSLTGTHSACDAVLQELGLHVKLSEGVWDASAGRDPQHQVEVEAKIDAHLPVQSFTRVLPEQLLSALQCSFHPASAFWNTHRYWEPDTPFFSYLYRLADPAGNVVELCIEVLLHQLQQMDKYRNLIAQVDRVEWWAHVRSPDSPHQLHFDVNEQRLGKGEEEYLLEHPVLSTILFLQDAGGPTIVLDQTPTSPLATQAYLVKPKAGQFTIFPGNILHGVLPGTVTNSEDHRLTLILAWWAKGNGIRAQTSSSSCAFGPGMAAVNRTACPLPLSSTPDMCNTLPLSSTPDICNTLPLSSTPDICNTLPLSSTPDICNTLPHSSTPDICNTLPHSSTPDMCNTLPLSSTPDICNTLPLSSTRDICNTTGEADCDSIIANHISHKKQNTSLHTHMTPQPASAANPTNTLLEVTSNPHTCSTALHTITTPPPTPADATKGCIPRAGLLAPPSHTDANPCRLLPAEFSLTVELLSAVNTLKTRVTVPCCHVSVTCVRPAWQLLVQHVASNECSTCLLVADTAELFALNGAQGVVASDAVCQLNQGASCLVARDQDGEKLFGTVVCNKEQVEHGLVRTGRLIDGSKVADMSNESDDETVLAAEAREREAIDSCMVLKEEVKEEDVLFRADVGGSMLVGPAATQVTAFDVNDQDVPQTGQIAEEVLADCSRKRRKVVQVSDETEEQGVAGVDAANPKSDCGSEMNVLACKDSKSKKYSKGCQDVILSSGSVEDARTLQGVAVGSDVAASVDAEDEEFRELMVQYRPPLRFFLTDELEIQRIYVKARGC